MAKCISRSDPQLNTAVLIHEPGGFTPLHVAAHLGHVDVVNILVEAGANVDILGGKLAEQPLQLATKQEHTGVLLALLNKRADINAGNRLGQTALHQAKSVPTLELLLMAGADKNGVATRSGRQQRLTETPLGVLVSTTNIRLNTEEEAGEATELVNILLRHGADATIPAGGQDLLDHNLVCTFWVGPPRAPRSLLHNAARNGVPGIVSALLGSGLDPSEQDEYRMAPLHYAAEEGHSAVIRLLLQAGAEVNSAVHKDTMTPLHVASSCARLECVLELLRCGADLDATCVSSGGEMATPLHLVGQAKLSKTSKTASRGPRECEGTEIDTDVHCGGYAGEQGTEIDATCSAVRRALQREDRWRRRGGVIVLLSLLNTRDPTTRRSDSPAPENTVVVPASPSPNLAEGSTCIVNLGRCSGSESDLVGAGRGSQDATRACPKVPRSDDAEGGVSARQEEGGRRKWSLLICAMTEDDDEDTPTKTALAGLMHLGWKEESLFRRVVEFL